MLYVIMIRALLSSLKDKELNKIVTCNFVFVDNFGKNEIADKLSRTFINATMAKDRSDPIVHSIYFQKHTLESKINFI